MDRGSTNHYNHAQNAKKTAQTGFRHSNYQTTTSIWKLLKEPREPFLVDTKKTCNEFLRRLSEPLYENSFF
jgi:hypothetical protein